MGVKTFAGLKFALAVRKESDLQKWQSKFTTYHYAATFDFHCLSWGESVRSSQFSEVPHKNVNLRVNSRTVQPKIYLTLELISYFKACNVKFNTYLHL